MKPIIVPTINNNDTEALLVEWLKADGAAVQSGEVIAVLETSKSTGDLASPGDGILHIAAEANRSYEFGATIGHLFADAAERESFLSKETKGPSEAAADLILTASARKLIESHGITRDQLRSLGRKVIKSEDLAGLIAGGPLSPSKLRAPVGGTGGSPVSLSPRQVAVARLVSRSHQTVAKSFMVKKVCCEKALEFLAAAGKEEKTLIALPDLIVHALSRLPEQFPFFFGQLRDDLTFIHSRKGNVGVTFDLGGGLFIPVIKGAARLSLKEIAARMMALRMKAARNTFKSDDLAGGDISVSINMDRDLVFTSPIIQVPQTCMVSLGAVQTELFLSDDGQIRPRRYLYLGAAFDHRVINGFQANAFLSAIQSQVDAPDEQIQIKPSA